MSGQFKDAKGLVWHNGGEATDDHLSFGGHETYLIDLIRNFLPQGGTFLDVGAHVGLYTLNLADKAGVVYSIEANPLTFDVLTENIEANESKIAATIYAFNFAAWDCEEALALVDEQNKATGGSTRCVSTSEQPVTWGVPLDDALSTKHKIDLVKIDVEGAEARVLKGMSKFLVNDRPTLFIEMHDMYFGEQVRLDTLAILEGLDYSWNDDLTFGGSYYIVAQPNDTVDEFVVETVRAGQ